ncbi:MAG: hypothetical protein LZF61_09930 [Nitrosomonas sp.]|nr:MAG: hypothetical protein LZF61_09930 [Nitrosomonas sp.]
MTMRFSAIIALSLVLGLIAGAGIHSGVILPVTVCAAAALYINRHKIAAQETAWKKVNTSYPVSSEQYYHAWPVLDQFAHTVTGECDQSALKRLSQTGTGQWTVYLIPADDDLYDSKAVRIGIDRCMVGQFSPEESRSFRHRLDEHRLSGQITSCGARITGDEQNGRYAIHLDIEPLTLYELPWLAG